jgi:hypothetical protein
MNTHIYTYLPEATYLKPICSASTCHSVNSCKYGIYIYIHLFVHIYSYARICVCICICIYTYIYICIQMYTQIYILRSIYISTRMSTCVLIIYTLAESEYIYIHIYIHIYIPQVGHIVWHWYAFWKGVSTDRTWQHPHPLLLNPLRVTFYRESMYLYV